MFRVAFRKRIGAGSRLFRWPCLPLATGCHSIGCSGQGSRGAPPLPASQAGTTTSSTGAPASSALESSTSATSPFARTVENTAPPYGRPPPGPTNMVWIPGGEFSMGAFEPDGRAGAGCGDPTADAQPVHRVYLDGFWMDSTEVTNVAFETFVRATGYVTIAERTPTVEEFPDAPPENLVAGSVVFDPPRRPVPLDSPFRWCTYIQRASCPPPSPPPTD